MCALAPGAVYRCFFFLFFSFRFSSSTWVSTYSIRCSPPAKPVFQHSGDVCSYWHADPFGLQIPKALYDLGVYTTLHGWWPSYPGNFREQLLHYGDFLGLFRNSAGFIDSSSLSFKTGCGHYREYKKHAYLSNYTFNHWNNAISRCLQFQSGPYVHQCIFRNGTNVIQSTVSKELPQTGCKSKYPYHFSWELSYLY